MPPDDEKLGHVAYPFVGREAAALLYEREAGQLLVDPDQECVAPRVLPIRVQRRHQEAPVVTHVNAEDLAQIVDVELEQRRQAGALIGARCHDLHVHVEITQGTSPDPTMAGTPAGVRTRRCPRLRYFETTNELQQACRLCERRRGFS